MTSATGISSLVTLKVLVVVPVGGSPLRVEDSTVLRNVGLPLAHTAIALSSLQRGLGKLLVNKALRRMIPCVLELVDHPNGDESPASC